MKRITSDYTIKELKVVAKKLDKKLFNDYKTPRIFWANAKPSEMFNYLVVNSIGNRSSLSNPSIFAMALADSLSNALYHERNGFQTLKRFHKAI
jgi:hypothetical protein